MIYILGGRGFVGSAYARLLSRLGVPHRVVTRDNYHDAAGSACDILINANGNSRKYLAEREPLAEFDMSVRSVAESLQAFRAGAYVFLSSGDVYPDTSSAAATREDQPIDKRRVNRYGLHKLLAETLVRSLHPNWLIVRMGGFVGPGLKKNAIFDMLTNQPIWLSPESQLQFISTDRAAALVWDLASRGVNGSVVNLGGRGLVRLGSLHERIGSAAPFKPASPAVRYELDLNRLAALTSQTLPASAEEVEAFIAGWPAAGMGTS
ncbi:MAG TPA: NAD(P)-dependent oxidoreductase [Acetobacteraceae bacterium]|nr:NAD(P)-dependent oxidoreductase [Acetobacteraceae bacterium]